MQINLKSKHGISMFLLYSSHVAGLIGLSLPVLQPLFLYLIPFHLLMSGGLLLWNMEVLSKKLLVYGAVCVLTGFAAEYVGVHTGWLFGEYEYGTVLGPRLWGIPLLIGVNWMMLIMAFLSALQKFRLSSWALLLFSVAGMVMLDVLIEPVAVSLEFWTWYGRSVPLFNYICWGAVSLLLLLLSVYGRMPVPRNAVAHHLLFNQFAFFLLLNIIQQF